jgi:type II restriction enzyme
MNLQMHPEIGNNYKSNSQIARILTEDWVKRNSFCPNCGENHLAEYENNRPVADFYCKTCKEEFELKSKNGGFTSIINDGDYSKMIERVNSDNSPNFFFLNYDKKNWNVTNFVIIPNFFFTPEMVVQRKPLSLTAKRAGWIGCNVNLSRIPENGKICLIKNSKVIEKEKVLSAWGNTKFLQLKTLKSKCWIIEIMNCLDRIPNLYFDLENIYHFENQLRILFPENNHIKDKIRQQLQILRDKNLIVFLGNGKYKKVVL